MRNRAATWVNLVFASIIVIGVFVQAYLIACVLHRAGDTASIMHGFVGGLVIHGSELIVFLSALVAFWRMWGWIPVNLGLFVFGTIQIFLLAARRGSGERLGARPAWPLCPVRARLRGVHRAPRHALARASRHAPRGARGGDPNGRPGLVRE